MPAEHATGRLVALDAFRGFAIAAMVLVNNPGDWNHLYGQLAHAEWNGWTFTDWIFPFFLFACGVSMPVAALPLAPAAASLVFAVLFNAVMFAVAWWMWKRRWFVKV
ncbi:MAG: heparan-alpha-glucosaminide N-acetyltransferase domain-containing protein [Betaproteobacteria bacterium]